MNIKSEEEPKIIGIEEASEMLGILVSKYFPKCKLQLGHDLAVDIYKKQIDDILNQMRKQSLEEALVRYNTLRTKLKKKRWNEFKNEIKECRDIVVYAVYRLVLFDQPIAACQIPDGKKSIIESTISERPIFL